MNDDHANFVIEVAYAYINGVLAAATLTVFALCIYASYRLFKWAYRTWARATTNSQDGGSK